MALKTALVLTLSLLLFSMASLAHGSATCPKDVLKIGACVNVLNLVKLNVGSLPRGTNGCCSLINGLADLEAGVCLCTALRGSLLGLPIHLPIDLSLVLNDCTRRNYSAFKCS